MCPGTCGWIGWRCWLFNLLSPWFPDAISATNPRVIDDSRARKLSNDLKRCTYYETCATYGLNVERVFQDGNGSWRRVWGREGAAVLSWRGADTAYTASPWLEQQAAMMPRECGAIASHARAGPGGRTRCACGGILCLLSVGELRVDAPEGRRSGAGLTLLLPLLAGVVRWSRSLQRAGRLRGGGSHPRGGTAQRSGV